jgi:hypothetical protein
MPDIEILGTGRIDERDSAFPQAVQIPGRDILCSFSVGGGPNVDGGTDYARSTDGGETWNLEGTILHPQSEPLIINFLKLSLSPDGKTIYAYGARSFRKADESFGEGHTEAIFCTSTDKGCTWSEPSVIHMPCDCPLEISHAILPLMSGRLLAPAAILPSKDKLGEQVLAAISDDGGKTWPRHAVVFEDPDKRFGYFEQKLAQIDPGKLMAVCWTVTLGDVTDQPDSFTISTDDGITWSPPQSTGIMGQTMTPIPLGGDRLLVLFNRRYGEQGIVMLLVTFTDTTWHIEYEGILFDAHAKRSRPEGIETGVEEFDAFAFGFPTAIKLHDGTYMTTHWSQEKGKFGIRWTKLRVNW